MRTFYSLLIISLLACSTLIATPRNLVVVNGTGETLDYINMKDSIVTLFFDTLNLYPNDFIVADTIGIAINSGSDDLYFYNMNTLERIGTLYLGAGRNPWTGAFLHPDTVVITNFMTSTITKVDVPNRSIISEHAVGDSEDIDNPEGILVMRRKAYICLTSFDDEFQYDAGKVEIYDLDANVMINRISVGMNPQVIQQGYDGYLYVLCTGNYQDVEGKLFKLDWMTQSVVDSLDIGGFPGSVAITKQGLAFLAAGGWPPPMKSNVVPPKTWNIYSKALLAAGASAGGNRNGGLIFTVDLDSWTVLRGPANPINTDWGVISVKRVSDTTIVSCNFSDDTITELDSAGTLFARYNVGDGPVAVGRYPDCFIKKGDADGSGTIEISDAVYLIAYIFISGSPAPVTSGAGDFDCTDITEVSDAVGIISYIFIPGAPGSCGCAD